MQPFNFFTGMKTTLIYPATKQHIAKYSEQEFHIVQESGEDYKKVTLPYVKNKALSNQVIYIYILCCSKFKYSIEALCLEPGQIDKCTSTFN